MNVNQGEQHREKNAFNRGQRTRKAQRMKKKHRRLHLQKKQPPVINPLQIYDSIEIAQFQNLSLSQRPSATKASNPLDIGTNTDPTLLLTDYSKMHNENFKEILLTSTDTDTNALKQLLDNDGICTYIRQLAQLVNKLNYSKLQNEQWTYYYNLGINEGIWTGRVSKKMADANSMCHTYGRSKTLIHQQQLKYKRQVEQMQSDFDEYTKQATFHIDMNKTMDIIVNLINKDQDKLCTELRRRRTMLHFDYKEHQLVNDFYLLKPRQTEVSEQIIQYYLFYVLTSLGSISKNNMESNT